MITNPFSSPYIHIEGLKISIESELFASVESEFKTKLPKSLSKVAMDAKRFWKSEAGRRLKSSRIAYQKTIGTRKTSWGHTVSVGINGTDQEKWLARAVEAGQPGYDMKPGFLKSADWRRVPLNPNHFVAMKRPKVFRTVSKDSKGWQHPGWDGVNIAEEVKKHIAEELVPQHIGALLEEIL